MRSAFNQTHTASNIYVRPAPLSEEEKAALGQNVRIVRDPEHGYERMPAEGGWVPKSLYWMSHVRDGSVILDESMKA